MLVLISFLSNFASHVEYSFYHSQEKDFCLSSDMGSVNDECHGISGDPSILADHLSQLVFKKFGELTNNYTSQYAHRKVLAGIVMTRGDMQKTGEVSYHLYSDDIDI